MGLACGIQWPLEDATGMASSPSWMLIVSLSDQANDERSETVSVFLKHFCGGFRPQFIAVCKPDEAKLLSGDHTGIISGLPGHISLFDRSLCTGDVKEVLLG